MENTEIAKIFYEIGDLLEVKGGDRFRIRSYRNAGLVIEGLTESLRRLYDEGGEDALKGIPKIGESIRAKIVELITTGRCQYLEDLLKEFPSGMLDVLKVSGIGPKKAALLYKELGIESVEALQKAASQHKVRGLSGFGELSEQKILKAISELKAVSARFKLSVALKYAESITDYIKRVEGTIDVMPAGSLRRWKDTIGDVDILVTCNDSAKVMDRFINYPDVKEVLSKGETKSTVVLKIGLQVDIRTLDKKSFGAALQYFTGSKSHNVALRDRAKRMGLKISEYGVFREKGEKWLAGTKEEDVYGNVGLPWIPPELRENRGEIEAAEEGRLPQLLGLSDIRGDLHVHTKESDGTYSLEDMVEAAQKKGYEYVAITNHSKAVGVAHGLDEKRVLEEFKAIDTVNAQLRKKGDKFRVLKGTEVDIRADGSLDHPEELLSKFECVVAAVHSSFKMSSADMTKRIIRAVSSNKVHILAHPTGRLIGSREPYEVDMEKVMDEAKRCGVSLELNSYPERLDLNDVHCRLAREKGVPVAISTDAHSIHHYDNIVYGIHNARRGWLEKKDILNARPLCELLKFLKKS